MAVPVTVRSVMHSPAVTVSPDLTLSQASAVMVERQVGAAAVLDSGNSGVGVISERDILRSVGRGIDPHTARVSEVMTAHPVTISPDATVASALQVFREQRFRHLLVTENDQIVGVLSIRHVMRVAHIEDVKPAGSAPELAPPGLEGVAVAETAVGDVRGNEGFFHYRGYDAAELARRCSFEQVWHLFLYGELPADDEVAALQEKIVAARRLPEGIAHLLDEIATLPGYTPLGALRTAVSLTSAALDMQATLDTDQDHLITDALRMAALTPVLMAHLHRAHAGLPNVAPDPDLGYAAAYLQMLTGERPTASAARALEQYLILTMDHGFNSSTFTARVITSTGSDMGSAITGAIGALAGPLHGGAPSRALAMLDAIKTPENAEPYLRAEISAGRRLMGFGHRVYKTDDPRSTLLRDVAAELGGDQAEFARHIESTALAVLAEMKPGRKLYTNVEFYAGVVMNSVGIPPELFTPTFACSRTVGWTAAVVEQAAHNRLIRPSAVYTGPPAPRPLPAGYGISGALAASRQDA